MHLIKITIAYISILLIASAVWIFGEQPAIAHGNFGQDWSAASQAFQPVPKKCTETRQKIDLNNANTTAFMDCPGFYPTLAKSIVLNSPYRQVEDVLNISDLSDQQKKMLKDNLSAFSVSDPETPIEMRMPPRPSMRANP